MNEYGPTLSAAKSNMTLASGYIRFMRTFAGSGFSDQVLSVLSVAVFSEPSEIRPTL